MIANLLATLLSGLRAGSPVRLSARISIGMAAHGNAATTRKALSDLFSSAAGDFDLILVDDLSADETLEVYREARRRHANTRIFSFDRNLEYCQSLNAFLSHARGDLLFFLSNDIFVNPSYLRQLLKATAAHPDCGILRGCSNFVDNSSPLHNISVEGFATRQAYLDFAASIARQHRAGKPVDERFLVGDAFLVSRPVIDRIGTIDTRFVGYCGDQDFGLRADCRLSSRTRPLGIRLPPVPGQPPLSAARGTEDENRCPPRQSPGGPAYLPREVRGRRERLGARHSLEAVGEAVLRSSPASR